MYWRRNIIMANKPLMALKNLTSQVAYPVVYIRPSKGWAEINFKEMWQYRDLLYFLTWRDIKVRYKQTVLGFAWAIIVPFSTILVFGTIFGKMAKLPSDGLNSYLFYTAGIIPWQFFANSLTASSNSLIGNTSLLTKIYLPRLFLPLSGCISKLVDLTISFFVMIILMLWYEVIPAATVIYVPLLILLTASCSFGFSLIFSALNVKYRDVKMVVPFILQIWMYCTILLPFSKIPVSWGKWRYLYGLNPMAGVVENIRWCLMHHEMYLDESRTVAVEAPILLMALGMPITIVVLIFGLYYFKRTEKVFADII